LKFRFLEAFVATPFFRGLVLFLILLNAVILGLETYPTIQKDIGGELDALDRAILVLFTIELVIRFLAAPSAKAYFTNGWMLFDILIVGAGYIPASSFISVARLFRIVRLFHAMSVMPRLQRIVAALLHSLPSLSNVIVLMAMLTYVYAIVGTFVFGPIAPNHFGSLHESMLTLFTVITLEAWVGVMEEVRAQAPWAWVYFVSYIVLGTFVLLNFFVGFIVNSLQSGLDDAKEDELKQIKEALARIEQRLNDRKLA
jgi:voltage-gated sodium channel